VRQFFKENCKIDFLKEQYLLMSLNTVKNEIQDEKHFDIRWAVNSTLSK